MARKRAYSGRTRPERNALLTMLKNNFAKLGSDKVDIPENIIESYYKTYDAIMGTSNGEMLQGYSSIEEEILVLDENLQTITDPLAITDPQTVNVNNILEKSHTSILHYFNLSDYGIAEDEELQRIERELEALTQAMPKPNISF